MNGNHAKLAIGFLLLGVAMCWLQPASAKADAVSAHKVIVNNHANSGAAIDYSVAGATSQPLGDVRANSNKIFAIEVADADSQAGRVSFSAILSGGVVIQKLRVFVGSGGVYIVDVFDSAD